MSAPAEELGVKTSKPIEIFDFVIGPTTYRYTSYRKDVVYAANTYTAARISRGPAGITPQEADHDTAITIDIAAALVADYAPGIPARVTNVKVRRLQNGVAWQLAEGPLGPMILKGPDARILVGQLTNESMRPNCHSMALGKPCQWALYEGFCESDRADHDFATTVSTGSGNSFTVASVNSHPDGWYDGGEVEIGGIRVHVQTQVGTAFVTLEPFNGTIIGQAITLYDGCRRDILDCRDRHDQVANYGGHPYLEDKNPFISRLAWDDT